MRTAKNLISLLICRPEFSRLSKHKSCRFYCAPDHEPFTQDIRKYPLAMRKAENANDVTYIYYIQINEIQENFHEITCIFQNVLLSPVKNIKSVILLRKNLNFWMTPAFSISFLCNSTISLQNFKRL